MNPEHYDRLNILKEIGGTFPGLPTEQILDLARWVEGNGTPANTIARESRKASMSSPRKWTNLDAIPNTVKRIRDAEGSLIRRMTFGESIDWYYVNSDTPGDQPTNNHGPFTEILENE